ncbi:MAG: MATE family efflux transporter [Oscillospiraceae bacterium]|nr:MATE family efflux transporter [Oscillospiraceae bacterium]
MNNDLTVGEPTKVLWKFCLPLFFSVIFQQLYNIADSLIAGKFIGEAALAAIGNSYEITLIFMAVAFGCNLGCSVVSARLFGAKKYTELKTCIYTAFFATAGVFILLMTLGYVFEGSLLTAVKTPDEIFSDSKLYLTIYISGLPFLFIYNLSTGIFSALGDSKTPFFFLAFSSSANIIMDIVFVKLFSLGVAGIAWATFVCQGISCVLSAVYLKMRLNTVYTDVRPSVFSKELLKSMAEIAVPGIFQQSFISVGNIIIQGIINGFGTGVIAGYAASIKLNNMFVNASQTLCNGIANYTAQNVGAKKTHRIRSGFFSGLKIEASVALPVMLIYLVFAETLVKFFMKDPSALAVESGVSFIYIVVPFYLLVITKHVADGILKGAGLMKQFMLATFTDLVLRASLAYVFSRFMGYTGIWSSWPIGWGVGTVLSVYLCYSAGLFKKKE